MRPGSEWLGTIITFALLFMTLKWTVVNLPAWVNIAVFIAVLLAGLKLVGMVLGVIFG